MSQDLTISQDLQVSLDGLSLEVNFENGEFLLPEESQYLSLNEIYENSQIYYIEEDTRISSMSSRF